MSGVKILDVSVLGCLCHSVGVNLLIILNVSWRIFRVRLDIGCVRLYLNLFLRSPHWLHFILLPPAALTVSSFSVFSPWLKVHTINVIIIGIVSLVSRH